MRSYNTQHSFVPLCPHVGGSEVLPRVTVLLFFEYKLLRIGCCETE